MARWLGASSGTTAWSPNANSYFGHVGPTLRVRPGDTVRIDLTNRLGQPTNLHGHGMFMSPLGISDNVLRVMKSDTFNKIEWKFPTDIEPGTYWYHTHLHGLVEKQVFSGLSGVLIVDGLDELLPPDLGPLA